MNVLRQACVACTLPEDNLGGMTMPDREKVISGLEACTSIADGESCPKDCPYYQEVCYGYDQLMRDALALLKEQDELLKHEYWRGYNNGRADERGLQEGTIMQTFSPD